ncbi:MAG: formyltetrahydrofolate deformylase [Campylobacteraceae bacterium 4484_166]|nr:MAG: formyltetrahydrofolate deformylase [Campylobacteraceae bacterium 4484_166]
MDRYKLLIETNDSKGLIYMVSKILFDYDLNIENNSEFVDKNEKKFFMRTEFSGKIDQHKLKNDILKNLHKDSLISLKKVTKKDIVILASKESHVLGDLLIRYESGELQVNIKAVISNFETTKNLTEKFDIPFFHIPTTNLSRQQHEQLVSKKIDDFKPDIIVLAKYMRVLTPAFVKTYGEKLLNIHHSFLPAFIGANPYQMAYDRGVKIVGATAHFVTDELDEGPIICQDIVHIDHTYTAIDMQKAGRNVEKIVLSDALNLLLEDRVLTYNNKTVIL